MAEAPEHAQGDGAQIHIPIHQQVEKFVDTSHQRSDYKRNPQHSPGGTNILIHSYILPRTDWPKAASCNHRNMGLGDNLSI
jgi:hypothetical protein